MLLLISQFFVSMQGSIFIKYHKVDKLNVNPGKEYNKLVITPFKMVKEMEFPS